jgi:hypothetical protein
VYREAVSSDQFFAFIVISAHATATQAGAGTGFCFGHPYLSNRPGLRTQKISDLAL